MYSSTFPARPFWDALARGEFTLPQCNKCGQLLPPGAYRCQVCDGEHFTWIAASGKGRVYSIMEKLDPLCGNIPAAPRTTIAVIRLDEGPQVMGIVASDEHGVPIDAAVVADRPAMPGANGLPVFSLL